MTICTVLDNGQVTAIILTLTIIIAFLAFYFSFLRKKA